MKIGILGGGQLGRMMALAGYPFNLRFSFYDAAKDCPSAPLGELYGDAQATQASLDAFIASADVFTYEFENIPVAWVEYIAQHKPVYPSVKSLAVSQNRIREKALFKQLNIPAAAYREVYSQDDLQQAVTALGLPLVVKTTMGGYDGKGQFVIRQPEQIAQAWSELQAGAPLIAEAFVSFKRELSMIAVRGQEGTTLCYPLAWNTHHQGILSHSIVPAPQVSPAIQAQAEQYITQILHELNHVGVLTLELFETDNGLYANETAPRVHNSGHWSIEGAVCSQFENHMRAVAGLPLGVTDPIRASAMVNIIGQHPRTEAILAIPETHLHLYGKTERVGRKLGHITVTAPSYEALQTRIAAIAQELPNKMALV
ncbi:5-(carboxyamino)imidazole ribonucleotide synthase [Agitococcus lubricus]|uniref:N5-carboxyaminoimidazole ribonucleotide synthase n=1 Tax=Agitococcus lubricus TaxID=1077255 RepID=A0A2T5J0P3_9GAMM|nr:5-(carboxyamino)imidazole ribonucleotide synthase [Agitococcus lubricus]PTQ89968.1 5-(carboxyamino)imidazole ribonucleotide synthase [Agitococcus lubricus]